MIYFYNIDIYLGITITLTVDSSQTRNGAISTCGELSVLLIWSIFVYFDSRNIKVFPDTNGSAVLLEFRLKRSFNNFIKKFYQVNVPNSFFFLYSI